MNKKTLVDNLLKTKLITPTDYLDTTLDSLRKRFGTSTCTEFNFGKYIIEDISKAKAPVEYVINPKEIKTFMNEYINQTNLHESHLVYNLAESVLHKLVFDIDVTNSNDNLGDRLTVINNYLINQFSPLIKKFLIKTDTPDVEIGRNKSTKVSKSIVSTTPLVAMVYLRNTGYGMHIMFPDCVITHDDYMVLCKHLNDKQQLLNNCGINSVNYKIDCPNKWFLPKAKKKDADLYELKGLLFLYPLIPNQISHVEYVSLEGSKMKIEEIIKNKKYSKNSNLWNELIHKLQTNDLHVILNEQSFPFITELLKTYIVYYYNTYKKPHDNYSDGIVCAHLTINNYKKCGDEYIYKDNCLLVLEGNPSKYNYPYLNNYIGSVVRKVRENNSNYILSNLIENWLKSFKKCEATQFEDVQLLDNNDSIEGNKILSTVTDKNTNQIEYEFSKRYDLDGMQFIGAICDEIKIIINAEINKTFTYCLLFDQCCYLPSLFYITYNLSHCENPTLLSTYFQTNIVSRNYMTDTCLALFKRLGKYKHVVIKDMSKNFNIQNLKYICSMINYSNLSNYSKDTDLLSVRDKKMKLKFLNKYFLRQFNDMIMDNAIYSSSNQIVDYDFYKILSEIGSIFAPIGSDNNNQFITWYWRYGYWKKYNVRDPCVFILMLSDICQYLNFDYNNLSVQLIIKRLKESSNYEALNNQNDNISENKWTIRFNDLTYDLLANRMVKSVPAYFNNSSYNMNTMEFDKEMDCFNELLGSICLKKLFQILIDRAFFETYLRNIFDGDKNDYEKFIKIIQFEKKIGNIHKNQKANDYYDNLRDIDNDIVDNGDTDAVATVTTTVDDTNNNIDDDAVNDSSSGYDFVDDDTSAGVTPDGAKNILDGNARNDSSSDNDITDNDTSAGVIPDESKNTENDFMVGDKNLNTEQIYADTLFNNYINGEDDFYISTLLSTLKHNTDIFTSLSREIENSYATFKRKYFEHITNTKITGEFVSNYTRLVKTIFSQIINFMTMIYQIMNFDIDKIILLLNILSSLLVGSNYNRLFIIFVGNTSNGKTLLFNLLNNLFNSYSKSADVTNLAIGKKSSTQSDLYHGYYCKLLQIEEISTEILDDQRIRILTGNSSMVMRQLYMNYQNGMFLAKILCTTNSYIQFRNFDEAMNLRLLPINFESFFRNNSYNVRDQMFKLTFKQKTESLLHSNVRGFFFSLAYNYMENMDYESGFMPFIKIPPIIEEFKMNYIKLMDDYAQFKIEYDIQEIQDEYIRETDLITAIRGFLKTRKKLASITETSIRDSFDEEFRHLKCEEDVFSMNDEMGNIDSSKSAMNDENFNNNMGDNECSGYDAKIQQIGKNADSSKRKCTDPDENLTKKRYKRKFYMYMNLSMKKFQSR